MEKLKVVDHPWHLGHSWDLLSIEEIEFEYLMTTYRKWPWTIRGSDFPGKWAPYYEKGKYDVAFLHLDQSCINPNFGKSRLFREVNEVIQDIPKIVIMHGTPMLEGYTEDLVLNGGEVKVQKTDQYEYWQGIKELVGDMPMVVNSHRAKERWGWGEPIWHATKPEQWWDLPKEPRVVVQVSAAGMSDEYYGRRYLQSVRSILAENYGIKLQWIPVDYIPEQDCANVHHNAFDSYRNFLGRSLVFFNPTGDSPMPRSRMEAMLSGCCVVTTSYHDEDKFIKSGENGFLVPKDAYATAELIADLIYKYPKEAEQIGQRGKETAKEVFGMERYSKQWTEFIKKVKAGYTGKDQERIEPIRYKGVGQ